MEGVKKFYNRINTPFWGYLLFWILVFLFSISATGIHYSGTQEIFETYGFRVLYQFVLGSLCMFVLVPQFLNKGKKWLFTLSMMGLLIMMHASCLLTRIYYIEPTYASTYVNYLKRFTDTSIWGRFTYFPEFLNASIYLLFPTCLLLVFKFYKEQQQLLKLNEQKKTAELAALKNQLNPHFLFNTLNNLYALALKKSDQTTEVIHKLSDILDYILYRCNDAYVPLEKEIELMENYIALEKIRYSNRVDISFDKQIAKGVKVAPLVLLTFIENAFKHGVSQELKLATITINVVQDNDTIAFQVKNTKPSKIRSYDSLKKAIGLQNVKKQLELLYPNNYDLNTIEDENSFKVDLKLQAQ